MQGFYIYIRDTPKGIKGEIKGVLYNARILYIYFRDTPQGGTIRGQL